MSKRKRHQDNGTVVPETKKNSVTQDSLLPKGQHEALDSAPSHILLPKNTASHMETAKKEDSGKTFTVAVIAFIIGFVVAFLIFGDNNAPQDPGATDGEETEISKEGEEVMDKDGESTGTSKETDLPATGTDGVVQELPKTNNANVSALNQTFGSSVTAQASTDKTSWVVVYEDSEGAPGKILGAKLIDAGRWEVEVKLLRPTEAEKTYYVKLQEDNGDRQFDYTKDLVFVNPLNGKEVSGAFQTTTGTPR